jgi:hypothetical protein
MSTIDDKYQQLKSSGLDLGPDKHPGAPDISAGFGGVYREYQNGNIYFHPGVSPEAHEVHGGILSLYLAHNGPGTDSKTGQRFFGFPKTDELKSVNETPVSTFEFGAIYWTQGTGGVTLTGAAYQAFLAGGVNVIGLPLTQNLAVGGGEAIYCERGIAWATAVVPNGTLIGYLEPPLLGTPAVINPTPTTEQVASTGHIAAALITGVVTGLPTGITIQPYLADMIVYRGIPSVTYDALLQHQPNLFADLCAGRFSLINTGARNNRIALDCAVSNVTFSSPTSVWVTCKLAFATSDTVLDSTLYDLELTIPNDSGFYPLSPHSVYLKKDWTNFGLLHITDLHLSLRNEALRAQLYAAGLKDAGDNYANCQDQFRDFIRYANHLHSIGLAHGIMATGDLVDYYLEPGDDETAGNFRRMRNMILGKPFDTGVAVGEELLLPIFTTFGNHDHRLNEYPLHFKITVAKDAFEASLAIAVAAGIVFDPVVGLIVGGVLGVVSWILEENNDLTFDIRESDTFDLEEQEVDKILGSIPSFDAGQFGDLLRFLQVAGSYPYFEKYFGSRNRTVALGPHRLVLLDSGPDAGVPANASVGTIADLLLNYLRGTVDPNTIEIATGCPNSTGYVDSQLDLVRQAIQEAGPQALVILGVHLPPVAPTHGYNDYCRETEHPTANPADILDYVAANKLQADGWSGSGTPYFKTGDVKNSLDFGIGVGGALDLLKICAGAGLARPIDLLLCGHHHDRVEYRVRWDIPTSQLQYFMDFYTENPSAYFSSRTYTSDPKNSGTLYRIVVDPKAPLGGAHSELVDGNLHPAQAYHVLTVPPYASPLNSTPDPAAWWQAHRPLLLQTAALGPIDPRQRYADALADPTFQGFRLMVVRQNVIHHIHYVTIRAMRAANFVLPFENEDREIIIPVIPIAPVFASA